jgi:hypothetical protein
MSSATEGKLPSPDPIFEAVWGFALTRILTTAVDLDIFTAIARGRHTLEELVEDRACSRRGLAMLLHAMTALKYLEARPDGYSLSPVSAAFLSRSSPAYIGAFVLHNTHESWLPWAQLTDAVRGGQPARESVHGPHPDAEFFSELTQSLYTLNAGAASIAARRLDDRARHQPRAVLDVGAGSAVWSLGLARQHPRTCVTVIDLPGVVETVTRRFVAREGLSDRFTFWPGDLQRVRTTDARSRLLPHRAPRSTGLSHQRRLSAFAPRASDARDTQITDRQEPWIRAVALLNRPRSCTSVSANADFL